MTSLARIKYTFLVAAVEFAAVLLGSVVAANEQRRQRNDKKAGVQAGRRWAHLGGGFVTARFIQRMCSTVIFAALDSTTAEFFKEAFSPTFSRAVAAVASSPHPQSATFHALSEFDVHVNSMWFPMLTKFVRVFHPMWRPTMELGKSETRRVVETVLYSVGGATTADVIILRASWETMWCIRSIVWKAVWGVIKHERAKRDGEPVDDNGDDDKAPYASLVVLAVKRFALIGAVTSLGRTLGHNAYTSSVVGNILATLLFQVIPTAQKAKAEQSSGRVTWLF